MATARVVLTNGDDLTLEFDTPALRTTVENDALYILNDEGAALALFAPGEWVFVTSGFSNE